MGRHVHFAFGLRFCDCIKNGWRSGLGSFEMGGIEANSWPLLKGWPVPGYDRRQSLSMSMLDLYGNTHTFDVA